MSITFQSATFIGTTLSVTASYVTADGVGHVEVTLQDQNTNYLLDGNIQNVNCHGAPQVLSFTTSLPAVPGYTYILKIRLFNQSTGIKEAEWDGYVEAAPNEVTAINSDVAGTSAVLNWTPSSGAKFFRLVPGGSGTALPAPFPTPSQSGSNYSWLGSLLNSTTYSGLIQSSYDTISWTVGAAFSFTTQPSTVLSALQTDSTTSSATIVIHPISTNTTVTCPGFTVTPSGSQPSTVTTFVISGLAPGQTATVTIAPSAGGSITQPIYATAPAPANFKAFQNGPDAVLTWTPPSPAIGGTPYLIISATPPLPSQPFYVDPADPSIGGYNYTGIALGVQYTFSLSFGQEQNTNEGGIATSVMSGIDINSVQNGVITWSSYGPNIVPPFNAIISGPGGFTIEYAYIMSPFTIPYGVLTSGQSYSVSVSDLENTTSAPFTFVYDGGANFGINGWFFSP